MSKEIHSDCECDQDPVPISDGPLPHIEAQLERLSASFEWLASVDLESLFAKSARLMKAVPWFMNEAHRSAMRIALGKIDEGRSHHAILRASHGCKLFLLLPRLLSTDLPRGQDSETSVVTSDGSILAWRVGISSGQQTKKVQPVEFRLLRVASDVQSVTMSRAGPPEPRRWCTWASYPQLARCSKVHLWHQGQTRRWPCSR